MQGDLVWRPLMGIGEASRSFLAHVLRQDGLGETRSSQPRCGGTQPELYLLEHNAHPSCEFDSRTALSVPLPSCEPSFPPANTVHAIKSMEPSTTDGHVFEDARGARRDHRTTESSQDGSSRFSNSFPSNVDLLRYSLTHRRARE
ncbi:hypothetical protein KM043_007408 [Ampulex compressa]|nr:hypothetical protein KM043_007408 [Ampulex compressa]